MTDIYFFYQRRRLFPRYVCTRKRINTNFIGGKNTGQRNGSYNITMLYIIIYVLYYMQCMAFDIKSRRFRLNDLKERILYNAIMSTVYSTAAREYSNMKWPSRVKEEGIFWWL